MKIGQTDIVIGKTRPQATATSTSGSRSFVSTTSNVTIRLRDESPNPAVPSVTPERRPSESGPAGSRVGGRHYAAVVARHTDPQSPTVQVIILGEPQDTIEEALEWLLDRTEIVVTEMLGNHRKQATTTCCRTCNHALTMS